MLYFVQEKKTVLISSFAAKLMDFFINKEIDLSFEDMINLCEIERNDTTQIAHLEACLLQLTDLKLLERA